MKKEDNLKLDQYSSDEDIMDTPGYEDPDSMNIKLKGNHTYKHQKSQSAVESEDFLPMNNVSSAQNGKKQVSLANSNRKKDIFSFGSMDPELLKNFGHLNAVNRYINLRKGIYTNHSVLKFPENNPFILSIAEYENLQCKLKYSGNSVDADSIIDRINKDFLDELYEIISIAFEVKGKTISEIDQSKRNNSIKVVIILALVNSCTKLNFSEYLATEAIDSEAFMTVMYAVCELVDYLLHRVTYVK